MEPLDPKAELMRLANELAETRAKCMYLADRDMMGEAREQGRLAEGMAANLSAAITLALAAERRRALAEAADLCDRWAESDWHGALLANQIRALIEKKD